MTKLNRAASAAIDVVENIALGFAQIGSMGTVETPSVFKRRTDSDALRSDWEMVGSGLTRSIEKARAIEKAR